MVIFDNKLKSDDIISEIHKVAHLKLIYYWCAKTEKSPPIWTRFYFGFHNFYGQGLDLVQTWSKSNFHKIRIKKGQFLNKIMIQIILGTLARLYLQYYVYYTDLIYVRVQLTRLLISVHTINN